MKEHYKKVTAFSDLKKGGTVLFSTEEESNILGYVFEILDFDDETIMIYVVRDDDSGHSVGFDINQYFEAKSFVKELFIAVKGDSKSTKPEQTPALTNEKTNMRCIAESLFSLLDDIDTLSDICKPTINNPEGAMAFYKKAMQLAERRFEYLNSDGFNIYTPEEFAAIEKPETERGIVLNPSNTTDNGKK